MDFAQRNFSSFLVVHSIMADSARVVYLQLPDGGDGALVSQFTAFYLIKRILVAIYKA